MGLLSSFAIVAGSMLGVGIFLLPSSIAFEVNSAYIFFIIWIIGGVIAVSGAVSCGELGAMLPRAGGDFTFQLEAFGPSVAFASGWVLFIAIFCGSIASMAIAVFQFQVSTLIGFDLTVSVSESIPIPISSLLAIALILLITIINDIGTRVAAGTQIAFTLAPILLLLGLSVYALFFEHIEPTMELKMGKIKDFTLGGGISALLFVNFAYSGWLNIIYVAGEVKNPGRNIPVSMFLAIITITALYCILCASFIVVLGFDGLASLTNVDAGTAMANALGSPFIAKLIMISIAVAILTSINATVLSSSRVAYAMAKRGAFWSGAAKLSDNSNVPRHALWIQAFLSSFLVLTGSFHILIEMTSIAMFITGGLTVLSLFVLRNKKPNTIRPYKANGYPWFPGIYLLFSFIIVIASVRKAFLSNQNSAVFPFAGVFVMIILFIGHWLVTKKNRADS
jgi:APA family basic amino acid/polyamine antiporter